MRVFRVIFVAALAGALLTVGLVAPAGASATWTLNWGSFGDVATTGQAVQYSFPNDVVIGPSNGLVYVVEGTDTSLDRVIVTDQAGAFVNKWGNTAIANGLNGNGQFDDPGGIAADASGNIYVADTTNDRIQKFDSSGQHLLTFGTSGAGAGLLGQPQDVAVDSTGTIYVADSGDARVEKYDSAGSPLTGWAVAGAGGLSRIAIGPGDSVYVSESFTANGGVKKFDSSGALLDTLGVGTNPNPDDLGTPKGVAVDSSGDVFVADFGNDRIAVFNSTGDWQENFGTFGSGNGQMATPSGVAVNSNSTVFVAEFHRMNKWTTSYGTSPPPPPPKPDGQIALAAAGPYAGNNVYQATPTAAQTKGRTVARTKTGSYYVKIQNDRTIADSFKLKGVASSTPSGFTIRYFRGATASEISTPVKLGTFVTPSVAPGTSYFVRVVVGVGATAPRGSTKNVTVTARSMANALKLDAVKAATKVA